MSTCGNEKGGYRQWTLSHIQLPFHAHLANSIELYERCQKKNAVRVAKEQYIL
jgi:hypothetical protein